MPDSPSSGNTHPHHLGGSITVFVSGADHPVPNTAKPNAGTDPANSNTTPDRGAATDHAATDAGE